MHQLSPVLISHGCKINLLCTGMLVIYFVNVFIFSSLLYVWVFSAATDIISLVPNAFWLYWDFWHHYRACFADIIDLCLNWLLEYFQRWIKFIQVKIGCQCLREDAALSWLARLHKQLSQCFWRWIKFIQVKIGCQCLREDAALSWLARLHKQLSQCFWPIRAACCPSSQPLWHCWLGCGKGTLVKPQWFLKD